VASEAVIASVKGIVFKEGKFLALKQRVLDKMFWDIPGGQPTYGEDPIDALKREVLEETGLEVDVLVPLGMWHFFRYTDGAEILCTAFMCSPRDGEIDITRNPDETEVNVGYRWFTPEEFLADTEAEANEGLRKIISKLEL